MTPAPSVHAGSRSGQIGRVGGEENIVPMIDVYATAGLAATQAGVRHVLW